MWLGALAIEVPAASPSSCRSSPQRRSSCSSVCVAATAECAHGRTASGTSDARDARGPVSRRAAACPPQPRSVSVGVRPTFAQRGDEAVAQSRPIACSRRSRPAPGPARGGKGGDVGEVRVEAAGATFVSTAALMERASARSSCSFDPSAGSERRRSCHPEPSCALHCRRRPEAALPAARALGGRRLAAPSRMCRRHAFDW